MVTSLVLQRSTDDATMGQVPSRSRPLRAPGSSGLVEERRSLVAVWMAIGPSKWGIMIGSLRLFRSMSMGAEGGERQNDLEGGHR
jgi:hypothetical protein